MIAVVIPCYRVRKQILGVLAGIGPECDAIYVVDDACPDQTGALVEEECRDPRVRVLYGERNRGVGGATLEGYRAALAEGARILVKLDGDGQMDPALIPRLVRPLEQGEADYAKGNRFFDLRGLDPMPRIRLLGNSLLSFATKLSSGYWNLFDPTNGFTALHAAVARELPFDKLAPGYFFESDLLFRLGTLRAAVCDVPMPARYGDEPSSLVIRRVIGPFAGRHLVNTLKRLFYNYYLRDFNIASIQLVLGILFTAFGTTWGLRQWAAGSAAGVVSSSGTVMLAALPVLIGVQLILAFLTYDLQNVPRTPLHRRLAASDA
ncbi:MAG: glycosyltransferase family 2 protein [Proteobacteria bacterium]|nr:glycosyltransferase family 2 protein [Pseudomonadota bacterium]